MSEPTPVNREWATMLGLWELAALGCFLGVAFKPSASVHVGTGLQILDLVRVFATTALAIVLVLGPGLALRTHLRRHIEIGFVPLPGLALLVLTGSVAWGVGRAGWVHPRAVCLMIIVPVLAWLLLSLVRAGRGALLRPGEGRVLLLIAAALGIAIARSLWSLGPPGELYGGTTNRTLEVGNLSDSRIPWQVVNLVANGISPFSALASTHFFPYTFSDRGPLAGLASVPVVMLTGGHPPAIVDNPPWTPFDAEGFMAYRLAMMVFAATSFLSLWTLTRRLGGEKAARLALLLALTTPFLVHEIWFTWPKMLAASLVLLSVVALLDGRPLIAGLLVGAGYLAHPLALLALPALGLIALWPLTGAELRRPRVRQLLFLVAGVAVFAVGWRLFNGSHYTQSTFLSYLTQADQPPGVAVTVSKWIADRLISLGNTVIPLRLFFFSSHDPYVNSIYGPSPPIVHFFFQYWYTLPFGVGIFFYPLLLESVGQALRRWPWPVTATVLAPFAVFVIWWGAESVGLLPAGLHFWIFTLVVVVALEQQRRGFPWLRNRWLHCILALRPLEVLLVAMLPTVVTTSRLIASNFVVIDIVAVLGMIALTTCLGVIVWREQPETEVPDLVDAGTTHVLAGSHVAGRGTPRDL